MRAHMHTVNLQWLYNLRSLDPHMSTTCHVKLPRITLLAMPQHPSTNFPTPGSYSKRTHSFVVHFSKLFLTPKSLQRHLENSVGLFIKIGSEGFETGQKRGCLKQHSSGRPLKLSVRAVFVKQHTSVNKCAWDADLFIDQI